MIKSIIAAVADNLAIGKDNALLWHLRGDMKYFRETTSGHPVIMGRKTFESIGRPLPNRTNIIISTSMSATEGITIVPGIAEAFAAARRTGSEECFIIGGGTVYSKALSLADRLYITHVHVSVPDADTFFPEIDDSEWREDSSSDTVREDSIEYNFKIYNRI